MFNEDPEPQAAPIDLERLSIEDLKLRIETLKADIRACEQELARKSAHKSAADALFGGDS